MYEEDRLMALDMYREMYDSCDNEQELSELLVSPTRQAVVIARAYDQRERKLQVHSQTREESLYEDAGETPEYVIAIDRVRSQIMGARAKKEAEREQLSLFSDVSLSVGEEKDESDAVPAADETVQLPGKIADEAQQSLFEQEDGLPDIDGEYSLQDGNELFTLSEPEEQGTEEPADDWQPELPESVPVQADPVFVSERQQHSRRRPRRELNKFLLVLYVIVAAPLGILGIAALLIPTLLFLALAAVAVLVGVAALSSALGGFSIFADLMVVLGVGLIALALGLLFLWLFVWFIGGVIAGFVSGVIHLGNKLCSREVDG